MSSPSSTPPLRLSAQDRLLAEQFFAEPDCPPSPSSYRPVSQYSIPRTVSRPGSWADFASDSEPEVELHCLPALRAISDVFPEGPLSGPANHQAQAQVHQSSSESTCVGDTESDFKSPQPSIITLSEESSASGSRSTDFDLYDGSSDDITSTTSEEQSLRRSRRSGFYGTPPTSATLSLSHSTDSGEPSPQSIFPLTPLSHASINSDLLDNPWLLLADELGRDGPPVGGLSLPGGFEPRRLSVVEEVDEEEEQRIERVRRSLSVAVAAAAMRRNKPLPAPPPDSSDPVDDNVGSRAVSYKILQYVELSSDVPFALVSRLHRTLKLLIAPLISLEEARKRFAHPHSLDIACSSRAADAEVSPPMPPPARRRSSLQSLRDRFSQLRVKV
ncbi:hypothetical protein EVG20_g8034 [Dentipellis fragilis]|uniref:Uncharacterized protein n=1 Tax=Dentipellis fragilis TaxID=205917 RepID=A0A4Y9YBA9_9AGAM|nr:hypothetical protein EVG20_g8034 [Dentipellis fragilis]